MSNTLKFEDVLNLVKENNPKAIEAWKDKKIAGAKTLFVSPYRRAVVDEVRFKIRGGAQISFIGDPDQEKVVKILGGKDRAQKTLDYLTQYNEEHSEELSEVDKLAAEILTTSLSKYIRILEVRQQEREAKKVKPLTRVEMQDHLNEIDLSEKSDREKLEEKKEYLLSMQDRYNLDFDILKHKLEGIRIKIASKTIVTKKTDNGVEVTNLDALKKLHDQFQALKPEVYEKGLDVAFIRETLAAINQELEGIKRDFYDDPVEDSEGEDKKPKDEDKKPVEVKEPVPDEEQEEQEERELRELLDGVFAKGREARRQAQMQKPIDLDDGEKEETPEEIPDTARLSKLLRQESDEEELVQPRFTRSVVNGEVAYDFGRNRDRIKMRRMALEMDLDSGAIKETFLMRFTPFRALRALIPSKELKRSAIQKLSDETIPIGSIYEIPEIGEIRLISDRIRKREELRQRAAESREAERTEKRFSVIEEDEDEVEDEFEPAEIIETPIARTDRGEDVEDSAEAEKKKDELFRHIEAAVKANIEKEDRQRERAAKLAKERASQINPLRRKAPGHVDRDAR